MSKKIKIHESPVEGNFTRKEIRAVVRKVKSEMVNEQYDQPGGVASVLKTKDKHEKKEEELEQKIVELNARIDTQYKLVDKLVRDVKRIKDQISVIAGKLPRG